MFLWQTMFELETMTVDLPVKINKTMFGGYLTISGRPSAARN